MVRRWKRNEINISAFYIAFLIPFLSPFFIVPRRKRWEGHVELMGGGRRRRRMLTGFLWESQMERYH
jgi:hypothetical protein